MANEPAYHSGLSRLVRPPSSLDARRAPGEMVGFLAGRLHQRSPGCIALAATSACPW